MDCCKQKHQNVDKKQLDNANQMTSHTTGITSKTPIIVLCLIGVAVSIVVARIMKIQIGTLLPYAIFLLCPLLHVFMMRNHGGHEKNHNSS